MRTLGRRGGARNVRSTAPASSRTAACTRATGSVVRHSDTLPPPQPSMPHGRQGCAVDTITRACTRHGPHSCSPEGPNRATTGVPIAAAMCIGAESTPTNARARAVSAASSGSESWPTRSTMRRSPARVTCARIASHSARSRGSGAPVSTSVWSSARRRSISAALLSAGQHLKSQRDPGWIWMNVRGTSPCSARSASARASAAPPGTSVTRLSSSAGYTPMRRRASRFASTAWRGVARGKR